MSFVAAAMTVAGTTAATAGIGTTLLAGGMMGAATTGVSNLLSGRDIFSNMGQGILMGGATAGIASGIGSALGGATKPAIDAAAALPTTTGNAAADTALQQANAARAAGIDSTVKSASADFAANPQNYGTGFNQDAYRASLQSGTSPINYGANSNAAAISGANTYSQAGIQNMLSQGMTPEQIAKSAGQYAAENAVVPAAGMQAPGLQTNIGNYLVQNPTKIAGMTSGLMALKPKPFVSPTPKSNPYYIAQYTPPGGFDTVNNRFTTPASYRGSYSPTYMARGGYVEDDLPEAKPYYGESPNTVGRKSYTGDVNSDKDGSGPYSNAAGGGPYSDTAGDGPNENISTGVEKLFENADADTLKRYKKAKKASLQAAAVNKSLLAANAPRQYDDNLASGGAIGYAMGGDIPDAQYYQNLITGSQPQQSTQPNADEMNAYIQKYAAMATPNPLAATVPFTPDSTGYGYDPVRQMYTDPTAPAPVTVDPNTPSVYAGEMGGGLGENPGFGNNGVVSSYESSFDTGGGGADVGPPEPGSGNDGVFAQGGLASLQTYAAGGRLLRGPGDGMSDSIPAVIKGARPQRAALADGEFVVPADVVSHLGNGSTEAGSKRLYAMMDKVRRARTGNPKQGKQINPANYLPA